jgi:hypothetical protein
VQFFGLTFSEQKLLWVGRQYEAKHEWRKRKLVRGAVMVGERSFHLRAAFAYNTRRQEAL